MSNFFIEGGFAMWPILALGLLTVASALGASCVRAIGTTPGVFTRTECEDFMQEQALRVERL